MNQWRAKHFYIRISPSKRLNITLRRFKTRKINRSKFNKQLVIPFEIGRIKEFSFRIEKYRNNKFAHSSEKLLKLVPSTLVFIGLIGLFIFGHQIAVGHAIELPKKINNAQVTKKVTSSLVSVKSLSYSVPTSINIPSVNISANIIPVGLDPNGSIQMPPILSWLTGWYQNSPTPGQIGPSVIVGHVDNYENISVFWRLRYINIGDPIYITRTDGSTVKFKVVDLEQYNQVSFPTQKVYGNINYPGLRLITCGGTFDTQTGSYDQNTVVYASMVQ